MRRTRGDQAISIFVPLKLFLARALMDKVNGIRVSVSTMGREKEFKVREGHDLNLDVSTIDSSL